MVAINKGPAPGHPGSLPVGVKEEQAMQGDFLEVILVLLKVVMPLLKEAMYRLKEATCLLKVAIYLLKEVIPLRVAISLEAISLRVVIPLEVIYLRVAISLVARIGDTLEAKTEVKVQDTAWKQT